MKKWLVLHIVIQVNDFFLCFTHFTCVDLSPGFPMSRILVANVMIRLVSFLHIVFICPLLHFILFPRINKDLITKMLKRDDFKNSQCSWLIKRSAFNLSTENTRTWWIAWKASGANKKSLIKARFHA